MGLPLPQPDHPSEAQGSRVQFVPNGDDLINLMNLQQLKNPNLALLPALTTLEVLSFDLKIQEHIQ